MRVTNSMLVSKYMNNLNRNLAKQDRLLNQMANNRKVSHYNEDPIAFIYSQSARQKLDRLEGYQAMVSTAQDWTTQVETGIMELNKILVSAYESAIDAATEIKSDGDKKNVSEYIGQLRDQLLQSLNAAFGDKFVFGGYNTVGYTKDGKTIAPFTVGADGHLLFNGLDLMDPATWTATPPDLSPGDTLRKDVISLDIGPGVSMPITINGIDLVMIEPPIEIYVPQRDAYGNVMFRQVQDTDINGDPMFTYELVYKGLQEDASGNTMYDENGEPLKLYETEAVPVMKNVVMHEGDVLDANGNLVTAGAPRQINNIFNLVDELYQSVKRGDPVETIDQFITPLQKGQRQMLSFTAEIGGRTNRLDMLEARYADDEIAYTQMKSNAEDADQAELIMDYKMAESIYKAALAVGSYVIKPTLMDFLR